MGEVTDLAGNVPEVELRRRHRGRLRWRTTFTCAGVSIFCLALWSQRRTVGDVVDALTLVSLTELGLLVTCWALWVLARTVLRHFTIRRATWRQSLVLAEVGEAAHLLPAGVATGISARLTIGRSFGRGPAAMSLSYLIVAEALSTGLWLLVLITSVRDVIAGDNNPVDVGAVGVASLGLLGTLVLAWIVARPSRITGWLLRQAVRLQRRMTKRIRVIGRLDLELFVTDVRVEATDLLRRRWLGFVGAAMAVVLTSGTMLVVAASALDVRLDAWALWGGFALVTAAIGFAPTPGGIGIAEAGMAGMLVVAGASTPDAVAVVLIHRGFTFVAPLLTGAVAFVAWTAWSNRASEPPVTPP